MKYEEEMLQKYSPVRFQKTKKKKKAQSVAGKRDLV